jgi:hypothetical protein
MCAVVSVVAVVKAPGMTCGFYNNNNAIKSLASNWQ